MSGPNETTETTTSADSTASRTLPTDWAEPIPATPEAPAAKVDARAESMSVSRTWAPSSTCPMIGMWLRAWAPAPRTATRAGRPPGPVPPGSKWRIAVPLIAAVRWAVIVAASITASGSPVRGSLSSTRAWYVGIPAAGFAGKPVIHLAPIRSVEPSMASPRSSAGMA